MPTIYLSPSTQEFNPFVNGGSEEEVMNRIADELEPWLRANGIGFDRNTPDMTAASSIAASNAGRYDLHLALHSNAAPEGAYGTLRGTDVYYYPGSVQGARAAELIAQNLKAIYPDPNLVYALPTTAIGEVKQVRAPAVFVEFAYHDNVEDATWLKDHIPELARNVALSLTEYFGLPFLTPRAPQAGRVDVNWGYLNIRSRPDRDAPVVAKAYDGARLTIWNRWENWFVVEFDGVFGFASADYITLV
jgi:N-acetylmuramoyl-L-alanine amidase